MVHQLNAFAAEVTRVRARSGPRASSADSQVAASPAPGRLHGQCDSMANNLTAQVRNIAT